jgi:DNA-directed RNA polymerase subunit M/transcription elongation factor TFIIS
MTFKRFCPTCGERLLPIVKADKSVYFDCLNCGYSGNGVEENTI